MNAPKRTLTKSARFLLLQPTRFDEADANHLRPLGLSHLCPVIPVGYSSWFRVNFCSDVFKFFRLLA